MKVSLRRVLAVCAAVTVASAGFALFGTRGKPPISTYSVVDVPPLVYRGQLSGRVRVVLRFPLRFSPDRRSADYSPSPGGEATKTARFDFRYPVPIGSAPSVVEGTVGGIEVDSSERLNRIPGYAVITDCVPVAD